MALAACGHAACQRSGAHPAAARPLRVLIAAELRGLDPHLYWSTVSNAVLGNIFDTLVRLDGSLNVTPGIAFQWINPNETTWRFSIDPRARFHDGSPVRAADVVESIERLRGMRGAGRRVFVHHVTGARVVDDATVDVITDAPAVLLSHLANVPILRRRAGAPDTPGSLLGSGPYRLVAWEAGREVRLEASPFWPQPPALREVRFRFGAPDMPPEEVMAQAPDLALFLRDATIRALEQRAQRGWRVISGGGLMVYYVALNMRPEAALNDARLREALDLALDRDEIVRAGPGRYGQPAFQLVTPLVYGFDPEHHPHQRDLRRARQMLAAAGRPAIDLSMVEVRSGGWLHELLARQWAPVGVRLRSRVVPNEALAAALQAGQFDVVVQGYSCDSGDAGELLSYALHSPGAEASAGNVASYANPEVDRLADASLRVLDPHDRLLGLQRALRLAAADRPYLPLYSAKTLFLVSDALRWQPPRNAEVRAVEMSLEAE